MNKNIKAELPSVDDVEFAVLELKSRIPEVEKVIVYEKKQKMQMGIPTADSTFFAMSSNGNPALLASRALDERNNEIYEPELKEQCYVSITVKEEYVGEVDSIIRSHGGIGISIR